MNFHPLVIQELKHDAPFAWHLRNLAGASPIFRSQHVAEFDNRLEAYLTCFEGSQQARDLLLAKLRPIDWGAVFITALVALRHNDADVFDRAVGILKEDQQAQELSDALCRVSYPTAEPYLAKLIAHENPLARIAAITATGFFRRDIDKDSVEKLLNDSPAVVAATLGVVGRNKLVACKDSVSSLLTHENEAVRFQAAYAGNLLGIPAALPALQAFCFAETPFLRAAIGLIYHVIPESDIDATLTRVHESAFSPRIKAYSIAMAGLPDRIPVLLEWMDDPEYAPVAGEAFSFITGVDIEEDDLSIINVSLCESQEAPLAVKRKKDRWTEAYEEDLPWPEPELVTNWWQANRHHFQNGTRYLAGKTLTDSNLQDVLKNGTQTQRLAASLILAVKDPNVMVRDVTAYQTIIDE